MYVFGDHIIVEACVICSLRLTIDLRRSTDGNLLNGIAL